MGIDSVIKDYGTEVLNAIRENDLQRLRVILEKQLRSNSKIAKLCITDIKHRPTKKFACPLILAARLDDSRIMKYMMDRGTDPNFIHHTIFSSKRREIVTALHISVDLGYYDTVEVLLNASADPNIADHNKETPLQIAVKKADQIMVRLLLSKGADPSITDRRENAALHVATLYGHLQMVKMLLKRNADPYQQGNGGLIPSHIAAREGHIHLLQVFCTRDLGNTNIKIPCYAEQREKAPIHLACEQGHVETVVALLDQFNADINLLDSDGDTPLHCVVLNPYDPNRMRGKDNFYATAKVLIMNRVSINEKNEFGDTALHLAAMNHFQRIVELLLSVGANPSIENDEGFKPIDIVPDSDPVTKQMLKSAMRQPKPPIHASQLSLSHDLDISFNFDSRQPALPTVNEGGGTMPSSRYQSHRDMNRYRSNASIHSTSTMASVFIDDVRGQQIVGAEIPQYESQRGPQSQSYPTHNQSHQSQDNQRSERQGGSRPKGTDKNHGVYQKMNEIPFYSKVDKHGKGGSRQFLGGEPQSTSSMRSNVQPPDDFDDDTTSIATTTYTDMDTISNASTYTYEVGKMETMDAKNHKSQAQGLAAAAVIKRQQQTSQRQQAKPANQQKQTARPAASKPRHQEQSLDDQVMPADEDSSEEEESSEEETSSEEEDWAAKKKQQEQFYVNIPRSDEAKKKEEQKMRIEGPQSRGSKDKLSRSTDKSLDDEGIQIHSIPGRPGTIEVQYTGGPITIAVDQQKFDTYGVLAQKDEAPPLPDRPARPKKKEEEDLYINQEAMMEHAQVIKNKVELRNTPGRLKEEEFNNVSGLINETTHIEDTSILSTKTNSSDVREAINNKITELTGAHLGEDEDEDSEEESEEEEESEDEEPEPEPVRAKPRVTAAKPKLEVPRVQEDKTSEVSPQHKSFADKLALFKKADSPFSSPSKPKEEEKPKQPPVPAQRKSLTNAKTELKTTEIRLSSYAAGADFEEDNDESEEEEEEESEEESESSSGKESIIRQPDQSSGVKPTQEIQSYSTEPGAKRGIQIQPVDMSESPSRERQWSESTASDDGQKSGLNLRVTGDVPKAYDRHSKELARRAFMNAKPEWIESNSDLSDAELAGSRTSLEAKPQGVMTIEPVQSEVVMRRPKQDQLSPPQPDIKRISSGSDTSESGKYRLIGSYVKPYSSFGKIEPKTDLIDELIAENRSSAEITEELPGDAQSKEDQLSKDAAQLAHDEEELRKAEAKLAADEAKLKADEAKLAKQEASLAKSEDDLTSSSGSSFDESQEALDYDEEGNEDDLESFLAENAASQQKKKPPRPKLRPGTPPSQRKQLKGIAESKEEEEEDLLKPTLIAAGVKKHLGEKLSQGSDATAPTSVTAATIEITKSETQESSPTVPLIIDAGQPNDEGSLDQVTEGDEKSKKKKKKDKTKKKKEKGLDASFDELASDAESVTKKKKKKKDKGLDASFDELASDAESVTKKKKKKKKQDQSFDELGVPEGVASKKKKKRKGASVSDDLGGLIPAPGREDPSVTAPSEDSFGNPVPLDSDLGRDLDNAIPPPPSGSVSSEVPNELDQPVHPGFEEYGEEPGMRRPRMRIKETSIDDDLEVGIPTDNNSGLRTSLELSPPPPLPDAPPPPVTDERPLSFVSDVSAFEEPPALGVGVAAEGEVKRKKKKKKDPNASVDDIVSDTETTGKKKKKKKIRDMDASFDELASDAESVTKKKKKKKKDLDASMDIEASDAEVSVKKKKKKTKDLDASIVSEDEGKTKKRKKKKTKNGDHAPMVITNALDDSPTRKISNSSGSSEPATPLDGFESTVMGAPMGSSLERSDTIKKNDSFSKIIPRKKESLESYAESEEDSQMGDDISVDTAIHVPSRETNFDSDMPEIKPLVMVGKGKKPVGGMETNIDDMLSASQELPVMDELPPMHSSPVEKKSGADLVSKMFSEANPPPLEPAEPVHFKRNLGGRRTHPRMKQKKPSEPKDAPLNVAPPEASLENAAFAAITTNLQKPQKSMTLPQSMDDAQVRSDMWQERKDQEADMQKLLQSMSDPASMAALSNGAAVEKKKPPKPMKPAHLQKNKDIQGMEGVPNVYRPQQPDISMKKKPPYSYNSKNDQDAVAGMFAANNKVEVVDVQQKVSKPPTMKVRSMSEDGPFQRNQSRRGKPRQRRDGSDSKSIQSDSEAFDRRKLKAGGKSISFGDVHHSDAEAGDYDLPKPPPGKSLQDAAMESITAGLSHQQKLINRQPSTERSINYTRGIYRPQPVYWRKGSNSGSRYDDSQLVSQMWTERNKSMGESEGEAADTEDMPIEAADPRQRLGSSTVSGVPHMNQPPPGHLRPPPSPNRSPGNISNVVMRKGRRKKQKDRPLDIQDPDPVDFNNFGMTAQLWMEQVDKKTVQKSKTMYMSLLPEGQEIPEELARNLGSPDDKEVMVPAQWVIARGRSIRQKKRRLESSSRFDSMSEGATTSGGESDWETGSRSSRPMTPGRQMLLFFKVGGNWQDLAWVLFDGVQTESETLRMIKDIQLQNKGKLTQQVQELMRRWWKRKGPDATIQELQRALEVVQMVYIQEAYESGNRSSVTAYTDTEEELDVSRISDQDPEVHRLNREYQTRSLNASFDVGLAPGRPGSQKDLNTDALIQKLEQKRLNLSGSFSRSFDDGDPTTIINRSRMGSGRRSRSSLNYSSEEVGAVDDYEDDGRRSFVIVQPQLKPKDYKHETTL